MELVQGDWNKETVQEIRIERLAAGYRLDLDGEARELPGVANFEWRVREGGVPVGQFYYGKEGADDAVRLRVRFAAARAVTVQVCPGRCYVVL
jgi:hypothetical protein